MGSEMKGGFHCFCNVLSPLSFLTKFNWRITALLC